MSVAFANFIFTSGLIGILVLTMSAMRGFLLWHNRELTSDIPRQVLQQPQGAIQFSGLSNLLKPRSYNDIYE